MAATVDFQVEDPPTTNASQAGWRAVIRTWWFPIIVGCATTLAACVVVWPFLVDDAAITFQFAYQWAHGQPLGTITPGQPLVSGFSNPVWTAILAAVSSSGLPIAGAAKVLGVACLTATTALVGVLIKMLTNRVGLIWFAVLFATISVGPIWAVSGLENAFGGLLVVLLAALLVRQSGIHSPFWTGVASSITLTLIALNRPDGFVFIPAAFIGQWLVSAPSSARISIRRVTACVAWVAPAILALAFWIGFNIRRFGQPLPNTVYAKTSKGMVDRLIGLVDPLSPGARVTVTFLAHSALMLLFPLILIAVIRAERRLVPVILIGLTTFALPLSEVDWMVDFRFYSTVAPLLVVLAAVGAGHAVTRISGDGSNRWSAGGLRRASAVGIALLTVVVSMNVWNLFGRRFDGFGGQVMTSAVRRATLPQITAAHRFALADPLIMTPDVGAATFDLDARVLDMAGLVDPQIAHLMDDLDYRREYAFIEQAPDIVRARSLGWYWREYWGFSPGLLGSYGYIALRDDPSGTYIRKDLVTRPSATASRPCAQAVAASHVCLQELAVPAAAGSNGTVPVRAWLSGAPTGPGTIVFRLERINDPATSSRAKVDLGAQVFDPTRWPEGEDVLHAAMLTVPDGSGPLSLDVQLVDGNTTRILASRTIPIGDQAVQRAVAGPRPTSWRGAVKRLENLEDLSLAAGSSRVEIDEAIIDARHAGLDDAFQAIRGLISQNQSLEPTILDDLDQVTKAVVTLRGRHQPDHNARQLTDELRVHAAHQRSDETRYRLLVGATRLDPTSGRLQHQLLEARSARPPRDPKAVASHRWPKKVAP